MHISNYFSFMLQYLNNSRHLLHALLSRLCPSIIIIVIAILSDWKAVEPV